MLEFIGENNQTKVFTFSVPPESEDFDFPQRVAKTKTFGGTAIDEYGNDSIKIVLSGTTVNEERKLIYRGNKELPDYMTGEKEIFELQKMLYEWGKREKLASKKVYLYDLSKMSSIQIATGTPVRNYWRVIIDNLKIKRGKDKPLTYNYTLEMTGLVDEPKNLPPLFPENITDILNKCQEIIETIRYVYEVTETVADAMDSFADGMLQVKKTVESIQNAKGIKIVDTIFDAPIRIIGGSNSSMYNTCKSLLGMAGKILNITGSKRVGVTFSRDDIYTISFNSGGGTYVTPVKVSYGNTINPPADPSRENFGFIAWYREADFAAIYDFNVPVTGTMTLYAKWNRVAAVVTFNSRQGTTINPQTVSLGRSAVRPVPDPTRNGYAFEVWCSDSLVSMEYDFATPVIGDLTLYARWMVVYTISFNSGGGTVIEAQLVEIGGKVIYPRIPERENSLFVAWCSDSLVNSVYDFATPVTGNMTLYAKWTRTTNDVSFDSNGGTEVESQAVAIGDYAVKPSNPTRTGYTFIQWCSDPYLTVEFTFGTTAVNHPITLYGRWVIDEYTVQFNSNGGSVIKGQVVEYGKLAVYPPIPEKEGTLLFISWCIDVDLAIEYDFATPVTGDMTLYAKWASRINEVVFRSNGGTEIEPQRIAIGGYAVKPLDPVREGYTFVQWCRDTGFEVAFTFETSGVNYPITLYAQWEAL
jgi:uncharacterized repeat protein (TIGR02543 family)